MTLVEVVLSAMALIGRGEHVAPSRALADGIAEAVADDQRERLTGSAEGDAVLETLWSYEESRWGGCLAGDGGLAWGPFQLQAVEQSIACSPTDAPRIWLARAHASARRCVRHDADERLAELASGSCWHGRVLTRRRVRQARDVTLRAAQSQEGS